MKNTIRHCISCILPCGSFDVIRIVHSNGRVEEINGSMKAKDVMKAHPKHLLKKPLSPSSVAASSGDNGFSRIVIVPPEAELQRGKIYFLVPLPEEKQLRMKKKKKKRKEQNNISMMSSFVVSDRYLTDILSEKVYMPRDRRRRRRVAVWRPNLESISESPSHL